jgi:hypothetical protein
MSQGTPDLPPVSSLDGQASRTLRYSERMITAVVVLLVLCLGALGYLYQQKSAQTDQLQALGRQQAGETARIDARVRRDVASICGFMKIVGTAQIPPKASPILVQWVESARVAYYGHGCAVPLPPPSPELRAKAAQYSVKLTR